jgi:[protein-PII] uridylyltransferase
MFTTPVQVSLSREPTNQRTVIELVASDRPGMLFQIGKAFEQCNVTLQNAKISTIGERAEDVFFVTTQDNTPLDDEQSERLGAALRKALAEPDN